MFFIVTIANYFLILNFIIKVVTDNIIIIIIKYHYWNWCCTHKKIMKNILFFNSLNSRDGFEGDNKFEISHFSSDWQIDSRVEASPDRCLLQTKTHCGRSQWPFKVHWHCLTQHASSANLVHCIPSYDVLVRRIKTWLAAFFLLGCKPQLYVDMLRIRACTKCASASYVRHNASLSRSFWVAINNSLVIVVEQGQTK